MLVIFLQLITAGFAISAEPNRTVSSAEFRNLEAKARAANHSNAASLLPEAERFLAVLNKQEQSDSTLLQASVKKYEETFNWLQRINPLNSQAKQCRKGEIEPLENAKKSDITVIDATKAIIQDLKNKAAITETREEYKSGICGVYNPQTQLVEWKTEYRSGVAGVYNPSTQKIEWNTEYKSGIAGVYNPSTRKVEWKKEYKSGVAGVYNPSTRKVEWKTEYKSGVAGVYNPSTQKVEWNTEYKSGIVGVYNPSTRKVEWKKEYKSGVAVVSKEGPLGPVSSCSYASGDDDDD
jgi:hypothetical protein